MSARYPSTPENHGTYRIIGARLIDGTGADPVDNAEIEVTDGKISYAGPARERSDDDVTKVDLHGKTVLPGFIDTHVHLAVSLEADPAKNAGMFDSERYLTTANTMRRTLMAGVTTARDLGGLEPGFRRAVSQGRIAGPRMHLALAVLSPTGGHADEHLENGVASDFGVSVLGINPLIDTDDQVLTTVRQLARFGADVIKVCTSGGVSSPTDTPHHLGVPQRHVRMIVDEMARRDGQPVTSHAQGVEGIKEALRGGVRSVEHGYEIDQEGIDLLLVNDAFLVPTLSAALRMPDRDKVPDYLYQKKATWTAIAREHLGVALQSGVKVAMGTDSGVCPHGFNLKELTHMVQLGMTPLAAIQAGTKTAAELMRLDEHLGTVEAGKSADLVVVDVDPLAQIEALAEPENVAGVIQGGLVAKDAQGWLAELPEARVDLG